MPTELDYARLAAYIDGEGCLILCTKREKNNRHFRAEARMDVYNCDLRLLLWCRATFGVGSITEKKIGKLSRRPQFTWRVSGKRSVQQLLVACLPYFITKKEQAEILLAFFATVGSRGFDISDETRLLRESLKIKLHAEKAKNYSENKACQIN